MDGPISSDVYSKPPNNPTSLRASLDEILGEMQVEAEPPLHISGARYCWRRRFVVVHDESWLQTPPEPVVVAVRDENRIDRSDEKEGELAKGTNENVVECVASIAAVEAAG